MRSLGSFAGVKLGLFLALLLLSFTKSILAQAPLAVYTDNLVNGFQDWSWAPHNLANTGSFVYSGSDSISVSATNWQAIWLYHDDFSTALYTNVSFWINGGPLGGQIIQVVGTLDGNAVSGYTLPKLAANTWVSYTVPFSALGTDDQTNCTGFWWQLTASGTTNNFYIDAVQIGPAAAPAITHIGVNATNIIRTADRRWFGINTAVWDGYFDTTNTVSELNEVGLQFLRFPGGSTSDQYNWQTDKSIGNDYQWSTSPTNFAHVATNIGALAIITANYGTGTAAEAAAWVKNANVDNLWGFNYWEIGNEVYGTWETDSNTVPNDPYTYATNAKAYIQQMKAVDPGIKIGIVVETGEDSFINNYDHAATNPVTGEVHYGWTPVLLSTLKQLGVTPDFAVFHWYPEYTDNESDPFLLQGTGNWSPNAADLRQMISDYLGPPGTNIELLVTENNSNAGTQGKQSVSLVNALYYADNFGQLMQTEFNSYVWWDLRNGVQTTGNLDPTLYGWRLYGDLGIVNGLGTTLSNRYPTFFTAKLMQYFIRPGDAVLPASSDYALLSAYAVRRTNGALTLLVINKDSFSSFTATIDLTNFIPAASAALYTYGIPEDNAAKTGVGSCDIASNTFSAGATKFNYTFAPYSATVLSFPPAAPVLVIPPGGSQFIFQLDGQSEVPYVLQTSTNLTAWTSISTNTPPSGGVLDITNAIMPGTPQRYWRALWQP